MFFFLTDLEIISNTLVSEECLDRICGFMGEILQQFFEELTIPEIADQVSDKRVQSS